MKLAWPKRETASKGSPAAKAVTLWGEGAEGDSGEGIYLGQTVCPCTLRASSR